MRHRIRLFLQYPLAVFVAMINYRVETAFELVEGIEGIAAASEVLEGVLGLTSYRGPDTEGVTSGVAYPACR